MKVDIKSLNIDELQEFVINDIGDQKFRAEQIYQWIHVKLADSFDEMTNLSKSLREVLTKKTNLYRPKIAKKLVSEIDQTCKYLFELCDGHVIESVLMKYKHGNSVCISSQAGCRMGCKFCASTINGLERNLSIAEMLDQVYSIQKDSGERVSNVVIMGSGEPLDNYDNVIGFIKMISNDKGLNISQRNITVSSCGIVPMIIKLAKENFQITLAISLHAADDDKRKELMPIAGKYSIKEILDACRYYYSMNNRRITFEYSLVRGVNDSNADAKRLGEILKGINCHINLIPVNPIRESDFRQPDGDIISNFKNKLEKFGENVTIRREMGQDIQAACGQLRKSYLINYPKERNNMRVFGKTDTGVVRKMNQDYLFYSQNPVGALPNLFIVADGMGGHKAGDYASRLSVETFINYVNEAPPEVPLRIVDDGIRYVNRVVMEEAGANVDYKGMGTTFVAAFIKDEKLFVANVGDSRLYLIDDQINQVTEDHSYVGVMLRAGEITKEEAKNHPEKNVITRAIGAGWEIKVDFFEVDLEKGDKILMCSDGLTNMVEDEDILDIVTSSYIGDATDELVEQAKRNGGLDNITVIIIDPFDKEVSGC